MSFNLDHTAPNMPTISHLSAQLATLGAADPQSAQQLWAVALSRLGLDDLRALRATLPQSGAIAQHIRQQLSEI